MAATPETGLTTPVRIGLLGAGAMGAEHAYCYGQMAEVVVTKVFSRDRGKAAAAADPLGAESTDDALGLIGDPAIDAIDVCLPTPIHGEFVIASLEAGKHVFCETPLSLDPAEGERMRDAARRAGRLLQVGLLMRSIAACRLVKQAADSGEYGRMIHVTAHRLGSYLRADAPDHKDHYSDPTTELMTFDLDFVGWLLGRPNAVAAVGGAWRGLDGDVSAHLSFEGGRAATVLASGIMPPSFPFTTGFRAVFEEAVIVSETVIRDGDFSSATHLFRNGAATQPDLRLSNPYQVELEHFIGCVRGAADVELLDVDRALEALALSRAIQACLRSRAPAP
jgi:predicted dehydrogenase